MAHIQEIPKHRCGGKCGRWAVAELVNDRNAVVGRYCRRCGERALAAFESRRDQYLASMRRDGTR